MKPNEFKSIKDSLVVCSDGPYFVVDTGSNAEGRIESERDISCYDCWSLRIGEDSVLVQDFLLHLGDTVAIEGCEFLPDSSRTTLLAMAEVLGSFRLRRADASTNIKAPSLHYQIVFDEPTNLGAVWDYIQGLEANWAQEVAWLTDLQYNIGAQYLIKCGYNAFSQFATSHLSAPWIPLQNVDGSFNEFRPMPYHGATTWPSAAIHGTSA